MTGHSVNMGTFWLLFFLFCSDVLPACIPHLHLIITAPGEMEALTGSCVQIPCNFSSIPNEDFSNTIPHFGIWTKGTTNIADVVFNSRETNPVHPINIIGNLSQRDCTTMFYNLTTFYDSKYFFRIENDPFKATASCDSVKITIKDSAPSPWIESSRHQLKEKESVTITCSALTPCPHAPPKLTWNLQQDAANNMEENTDRTFTTKIQQTITVSERHDGFNISCSAAYPVNQGTLIKTAETNFPLSVSYAPKDTSASISPSGLVGEGIWVNLTCSSRANPPVNNFTWFKTSTHGPIRVSGGDVYSFSLTHDTEGDYYCEAENDVGKQTSTVIHVNIKGETIFVQWEPILGGVVGILIIILLAVCLWCLILKRRTQKEPENQTLEELPDVSANKTEEEIQYGEIDFSEGRSRGSCPRGLDTGHQQETVYAQVKVSGAPQSLTHTGGGSDDLYAQVKKTNTDDLYAQVKKTNTDDLYAQVKKTNTDDLYAQVKKK